MTCFRHYDTTFWRPSTRFRLVLAHYQYSNLRKQSTLYFAMPLLVSRRTSEKQAQKFYAGGNLFHPIRSTTQIRVVTRHQFGIFALVSQTSFRGKPSGGVAKLRLFFRDTNTVPTYLDHNLPLCIRSALCLRKILTFQNGIQQSKRRSKQ